MKMRFAIAFALLTLPVSAQANGECMAKGEPIQWIADYCMLKMETDDEIAVSGCIDEESKKSFRNGCASNMHFKRSMCEVLVRAGTREGSVEQCVKDPTFKGRTVEAGGVGA